MCSVATSAPGPDQWVSCSEAARLLESYPAYVRKLALDGLIATKVMTKRPIKFSRADVIKIRNEATKLD